MHPKASDSVKQGLGGLGYCDLLTMMQGQHQRGAAQLGQNEQAKFHVPGPSMPM